MENKNKTTSFEITPLEEPDTEVLPRKTTKKVYSFKPAKKNTPKSGDKIYEVGLIKVFIPFSISFILAIINLVMINGNIFVSTEKNYSYYINCIPYLIIFLAPALIYCKVRNKNVFKCASLHRFSLSYTVFIILCLIQTIFIVTAGSFAVSFYYPQSLSVFRYSLTGTNNILNTIMFFGIIPAVCEEFFIRGIIQTGINKIAGGFAGIIISSLAFALLKLDLHYFPVYFVTGLILGFVMHITCSVVPCMIIRIFMNVFMLFFAAKLSFIANERAGNMLILVTLAICIFVTLLAIIKATEKICIAKALSIEMESTGENTSSTPIKFYSKPYKLSCETGYSLHKFLRVLFSPALIVAAIVFLIATIL